MRHLTGVALAVALGAAVFFAATWGYLRLLTIPVTNGGGPLPGGGGSLLHDTGVLEAFAALAGTALLAGICVAVRRISPLAAGLPGLVLLAWTVVYGINVSRAVRYIPFKYEAFGDGFEAMLISGLLAAAGLVLVVPLFIPSRWRAQGNAAAGAVPGRTAGGYAPAGGPGFGPAPAYPPQAPTATFPAPDWNQTAAYPTDQYPAEPPP
jgi:hypothetical protein